MRDHRPTLTEDIISKSKLAEIQQHAAQIHQLNQTVLELLPQDIRRYCRVANCRGSQLILEVANAAIKMKLSYDRLHLLSQLRQKGFARLINIDINVRPELYINEPNRVEERKVERPPLSKATADNLNMLAEMAPDKIKKRLQNIAKLADKN
ncbi:Zn-ribbon-containing [Vibrio ishigakensis]|uniref:Zn-ribbon-containing n=1 Tax=Vibrio ishigakensis TaxID=1481914 RepID=A0A0B8QEH8_9VIBR|nr:Zn-ribbon-containing [Vibrio ishigakensis]